ncbi:hypothetical protein ABW21_db0206154 [Orbilia brochopaga]|nr:hypothetical protein ABW21_db0206154 [Drechslerella brochopaga]
MSLATDTPTTTTPTVQIRYPTEPYKSFEILFDEVHRISREAGYAFTTARTKHAHGVIKNYYLKCDFSAPTHDSISKGIRKAYSKRTNCPAEMMIFRQPGPENKGFEYRLFTTNLRHNHEPAPAHEYPAYTRLSKAERAIASKMLTTASVREIHATLVELRPESSVVKLKSIHNMRYRTMHPDTSPETSAASSPVRIKMESPPPETTAFPPSRIGRGRRPSPTTPKGSVFKPCTFYYQRKFRIAKT